MASINFLYRSTKDKSNLILRFLFRHNGKDYVFGSKTKLEVEKAYWTKQHNKKSKDIEITNKQTEINIELNKIENHILGAFNSADPNKVNKEWISTEVDLYYNPLQKEKTIPTDLINYIDFYIDYRKDEVKKTSQKKFNVIKHKLQKLEKAAISERLTLIDRERNSLKSENIAYQKAEEGRQKEVTKSIASALTLQESLEAEKSRLNDERVKEKEDVLKKMKLKWSDHEKDVQNHLKLICRNNVITYVSQEDFPHPRNKPDSSIEIMDQLIVFDAKSPANDDLSNFPKYIKNQTENLKKYAKHDNVKNDLFLVIPSNTLEVINQFHYNIGDYNVFVITKDALEPIVLSLKKIEEYEFADKLSPEERDNVCRIIGKFAHTTKRRIQIDEFFAREFLDTLSKAGSQLPRDILENVIKFENAEKLNPPMEKRNKKILTKDLKEQVDKLEKEMELREIPKISNQKNFDL